MAARPSTNIPQPAVEQPDLRLLMTFRLGGGIGRRGAVCGGGMMTCVGAQGSVGSCGSYGLGDPEGG